MTNRNKPKLAAADIEAARKALREGGCSPELILYIEQLLGSSSKVRWSIKDSIFTNLFSRPQYLLELYKTLHPEDSHVELDDLEIVTLENIIANGIRNDLGFAVRGHLLILMEAQSTWSMNIVLRELCYLAHTYEFWLESTKQLVYGRKKVAVPKPELYAIFPGMEGPNEISLAREFFEGDASFVECKVRCIYSRRKNDILAQYIRCTEICDEEIRKGGRAYGDTAAEIRRRCIEDGVLASFMEELGGELVRIVEYRSEAEIQELLIAGSRKEGVEEGRQEEREEIVANLVKSRILTPEQIASGTGVSLDFVHRIEQKVREAELNTAM